jgi:hypothetical protein
LAVSAQVESSRGRRIRIQGGLSARGEVLARRAQRSCMCRWSS